MSTVEIMSHPRLSFPLELKDFFAWLTQYKQASLKWAGTHTPDFSTWSILWRWSSHHGIERWNGNSSLFLCLVIIFPPGFQCKSAQISLSVTSVNNRNKERTGRCQYVPLRQFTCHRIPPPPHPNPPPPPRHHRNHPPPHFIDHLPEHRSGGSQPRGAVWGEPLKISAGSL